MDLFMVGSTWRSVVWQFMVGLFSAMYKSSRSINLRPSVSLSRTVVPFTRFYRVGAVW